MGRVVQRHFKWRCGKQMNGLASSKQGWTKMDMLEGKSDIFPLGVFLEMHFQGAIKSAEF